MKKKIAFVLCMVLIVAAVSVALVACNSSTVTVTYMDGDKVLKTDKVTVGETFTLYTPTKENAKFVNWYTDKDLTTIYVADKLMEELTLYAKFEANSCLVIINANGGTLSAADSYVTVTPGEAYTLPVPTREGYTFAGYTLGGEAFATEGTFTHSDSVVVLANWEVARYSVRFMDGDTELFAANIEHGGKASYVATKDGYDFVGWEDQTGFMHTESAITITADSTFTALWSVKTYNMVVENLPSANHAWAYNSTYRLPENPTLPEWASSFLGYTMGGEAFEASGTYTWTTDVTVTANFERDPMYNKSQVTVYTTDTTTPALAITVDDGSDIAEQLAELNTAKDGYTFAGWTAGGSALKTTVITDNITIYAAYEAKSTTVTVVRWDTTVDTYTATYGVAFNLSNPEGRNGYRFAGYERMDGTEFAGLTLADYDAALTLREVWEQLNPDQDDSQELFVRKDTYFKERESLDDDFTYVFLTGYTYNLADITAITGADEYMDVVIGEDGASLTIGQTAGSFSMTVTKTVEDTPYTYQRNVKVVNNVDMEYGADYLTVWQNATQSGNDNFQAARTEESVMAAGVKNFKFDLALNTEVSEGNYSAISFDDANLIVKVEEGNAVVEATKYTINDGAITFADEMAGHTVVITLAPKYSLNDESVSFRVALNAGVNVYTSAELKANYADESVHAINILRNITAELVQSDYIANYGTTGSVQLLDANKQPVAGAVLSDIDMGTPYNDYSHGVYTRLTSNTSDTIQINGNYFKIDGNKLPYIDNAHDQYGAGGSKFTDGNSYRVANVQIGIFLYRNYRPDIDGSTLARYSGGTMSMDNLYIEGNNVMQYGGLSQDLGDGGNPLLKMSAAYLGIVCRGGTVNLENVTVTKTSIGIFTDGQVDGYTGNTAYAYNKDKHAVVMNMNNCRVFDSWANDVYGYHLTQFNLTNCKFGATSGGAAIAFDDVPVPSSVSTLQTELNMDAYTAQNIVNWVTGQEAWFVAYGHSDTAIGVKTNINDSVKDFGLTDLDSTGNRMNFAVFARSAGSYDTSRWYNNTNPETADAQGQPSFTTNIDTIPAAVLQGLLGVDADTAAYMEGQLEANGIGYWVQSQTEFQVYLVYGLGERNSRMIVGIPLYMQAPVVD